ncbi:hypothetical protein SAMN04487910_3684 [Aquimarina amphilecti]|uniref:Uncharacterized protein n=1 Tax=Aquimarina amphilecti TaxID=1038014 RepID=A0A1H7UD41_AQUAM|nr:hypothetical protein [Aquimarina amphilecti]SEL94881.1 hypothetical protein SAMN04487910_3684 [Aquimarina amphilecti]
MKFVKDEDEERRDYIFQNNTKTKVGTRFIIIVLVLLILGVIASGLYLEVF